MDSSSAEHGGNIFLYLFQRHDRMWVPVGGMSELFQSREGLFGRQIKHACMSLNDLKVESRYLIEEGRIGSKPRSMNRFVVQNLLDRGGGFSHARFPSVLQCS